MAINGNITHEGDKIDITYTGGTQTYTIPESGLYKLECYGAQGNGSNDEHYVGGATGGLGGYSASYVKLKKHTPIYIVAGGVNGYNGGYGGGGGATHIAISDGTYFNLQDFDNDLLVIAGGGAGGIDWSSACSHNGAWGRRGKVINGSYGNESNNNRLDMTRKGLSANKNLCGGGYYPGKTILQQFDIRCGLGQQHKDSFQIPYGGSGFALSCEFRGKKYESIIKTGDNNGNGRASITFIARDCPSVYYNGKLIQYMYYGDLNIIDIKFH